LRDVNHIILDFESKLLSRVNWNNNFILESSKVNNLILNTTFKKKHLGKFFSNKLLNDQEKFTLFFLNKSIFKKNKIDLKYRILISNSSIFSRSNSFFIHTRKNLYDNYFDYVYRYIFFFI
jgi:hypothetical protein